MIVPKHRRSAVERNRLKRRLRELVRIRLLVLPLTIDLVIRARPEAYGADFDALSTDIARAATQLMRWEQDRVASLAASSARETKGGDTS